MTTALVWGLKAVGIVLATGFCFRVAAGMVHVEGATFGRAMLSALFSAIVAAAVAAIVFILTVEVVPGRPDLAPWIYWLGLVLVITVSVAVLRNGFSITFGKAAAVWCAAMGLAALLAVLLVPAWPSLAEWLERLVPTAV
ncbi:MAG: hypothetical protein NTX40_10045 [Planctomycetota bacterium]|nr:hypothetical protein [Planctomycetota bacterium]